MPLGRNTTALIMWTAAVRDMGEHVSIPHFERFALINRAVARVFNEFAGLMKDAYMTSATVTASNDAIDISSLEIARMGLEVNFSLESSDTNYVDPVSISEVRTFRGGALQNLKRIVWAYAGDSLLLAKGTSVAANYGTTITFRYPRTPIEVSADATKIDLPEGAPMALSIEKLKRLVAQRSRTQLKDDSDLKRLVIEMYQSFGQAVSGTEIEKKVQSLT